MRHMRISMVMRHYLASNRIFRVKLKYFPYCNAKMTLPRKYSITNFGQDYVEVEQKKQQNMFFILGSLTWGQGIYVMPSSGTHDYEERNLLRSKGLEGVMPTGPFALFTAGAKIPENFTTETESFSYDYGGKGRKCILVKYAPVIDASGREVPFIYVAVVNSSVSEQGITDKVHETYKSFSPQGDLYSGVSKFIWLNKQVLNARDQNNIEFSTALDKLAKIVEEA